MKNKTGKSSSAGAIIAALCIIIYVAALVQAAVRMYLSVDNNRTTAQIEFDNITGLAVSAGARSFMDNRFIETINYALSNSKTIEAIIITGPDGEYVFEKQKGYAVTWINNSPRFINRFSFSSQNYYNPLLIPNLRNTNIRAVAGAYDYAQFTQILKETLFMILAGFGIAFFTILLQALLGKPAEKKSAKSGNDYDFTEEKTEPKQEPEIENYFTQDTSEPKGLYSPRSNVGWEEYTKDRLDSELHRCASTEKDLTLIVMEFTDKINDIQFKEAAEAAVLFFTSRDLLFEYGQYGITIINPGIDLEASLAKVQKFHKRIMEKIFFNHKTHKCLYIGLSSRSGRLINAGRMLMEVKEALQKAKTDPQTSIVAFKSDPEKYRKFIASQNQQQT